MHACNTSSDGDIIPANIWLLTTMINPTSLWTDASERQPRESFHVISWSKKVSGRPIQIIQKGATLGILIMQGRLAVTRSLFCNLFLRFWRTNRCRERSREERECKSGISHSWSFIHAKFASNFELKNVDKIERRNDGMKGLKNGEGEGVRTYILFPSPLVLNTAQFGNYTELTG